MPSDFGYEGGAPLNNEPPVVENNDNDPTPLDGDEVQYDANGNPITPINNNGDNNDLDPQENADNENELEAGTEIQVGDETYTVDENGNVVDKDGNIYKESKDVKAWIDSFEQEESSNEDELTIENIQKLVGFTVTDDDDKEIQFENTPQGVKSYIEQVIESAREEHYETAINTFMQNYPFIPDIINYYKANGGSLEGYNEVPDRSNTVIDENNEAQQEYIIKTAWKEQNRRGNVDNYINYLKSSGTLFETAKEELEALKQSDKEYREYVKQQAEAAEQERIAQSKAYWQSVYDVVKSKTIAGYDIPESIVVTRNGQKTTSSINDFFNYMYQVDDKGKSRYQYDLEAEDPMSRLNDDILRAYLKFTGGSYANLVDMAINKKQVNKLILKSKETKKPSMSIKRTTPKTKTTDLGYN